MAIHQAIMSLLWLCCHFLSILSLFLDVSLVVLAQQSLPIGFKSGSPLVTAAEVRFPWWHFIPDSRASSVIGMALERSRICFNTLRPKQNALQLERGGGDCFLLKLEYYFNENLLNQIFSSCGTFTSELWPCDAVCDDIRHQRSWSNLRQVMACC